MRCPECRRAIQLLDPRRATSTQLGDAMRRAAEDGLVVELTAEPTEAGCSCPTPVEEQPTATPRRQINLKQILLLMATVALLLSIFRHPISWFADQNVLGDKEVLRAAAAPWSLYGWLFFGTPVINPKSLSKTPLVIAMLLANIALAGMLPFLVGGAAAAGFKRLWRIASQE